MNRIYEILLLLAVGAACFVWGYTDSFAFGMGTLFVSIGLAAAVWHVQILYCARRAAKED